MPGLPKVPKPSSLLWEEGLSQPAKALKEECLRIPHDPHHRSPELVEQDAKDLHRIQDDRDGCAVVLIYLADLYRNYNRFYYALKCSEKAEKLFCCWPEAEGLHNHAVALYSVGLAHQHLGSEKNALDYHDRALAEFERAKEQWRFSGDKKYRKQCDEITCWIKWLRDQIAQARSHDQFDEKKVGIPVLSRIAAGKPILISENIEGHLRIDDELAKDGLAKKISFALRVKGDSMVGAGIHDGEVVLIEQRQDNPPNGRIVAIIIGDKATLKRFYLEDKPRYVRLEPANDSYPTILIGPASSSEKEVRDHYRYNHPNRPPPDICSGDPEIAGWVVPPARSFKTFKIKR